MRKRFDPMIEPWIFFSWRKSNAGKLEHRADRRQADDGGRAAGRQHPEGLLARRLPAERFERVLDATARELLHLAHRIAGRRVHGVGRAERTRAVELLGGDVDRDHAGGTGDHRALHDVRPMPPQPMTATVAAGWNLRGVEHRAETMRRP